ncbi:MAG: DinB family protein [Aggregatilineales bacterium]
MSEKDQLVVVAEGDVLRAMWRLDDARARTRKALTGMEPSLVDWQSQHHSHTIGTILYHVAAIELDWLIEEILEGTAPDEGIWELFPYEVRDDDGSLMIVTGHSLDWYWQRLDRVREAFQQSIAAMSVEDFRRKRVMAHYDVTPEWVLHHLAQHEAEHRGELMMLRAMAEQADS